MIQEKKVIIQNGITPQGVPVLPVEIILILIDKMLSVIHEEIDAHSSVGCSCADSGNCGYLIYRKGGIRALQSMMEVIDIHNPIQKEGKTGLA